MTDREIILESRIAELERRNAELESDIIEYRESITSIDEMNHNLTRKYIEVRKRNAELVGVLRNIDREICSFCVGKCSFKLHVENQPAIYRMCERREIIQSAIRTGKDV